MSRKKSGISIGSLLFWGFLGWSWWGDDIKIFISTDSDVKVAIEDTKTIIDEEIKPEIKKLVDNAKTEFEKAKTEFEVNKEKKEKLPEKNVDKSNDDPYEVDNKYGDNENKW